MIRPALSVAAAIAAPVAAAGPLSITSQMLKEQRTAAADGTTRVQLVPIGRAVPGDRLTVVVAYRNAGGVPIASLTLVNPVPTGVAYRGAAPGSPTPDLSVDGVRFGPLAALSVAGRPAGLADVTHVRWRIAKPVAAGGGGQFAFLAVLK